MGSFRDIADCGPLPVVGVWRESLLLRGRVTSYAGVRLLLTVHNSNCFSRFVFAGVSLEETTGYYNSPGAYIDTLSLGHQRGPVTIVIRQSSAQLFTITHTFPRGRPWEQLEI